MLNYRHVCLYFHYFFGLQLYLVPPFFLLKKTPPVKGGSGYLEFYNDIVFATVIVVCFCVIVAS